MAASRMHSENEILWPSLSDVAFGASRHPDIHSPTVAFVEHVSDQWTFSLHADAFEEAANLIVDALTERKYPFHPDSLFFPVAHLYRHAIELGLKDAIEHAIRINLLANTDKTTKALREHNLYQLWNILKPALLAFWPKADPTPVRAAERVIAEFHNMDTTGQRLRYPKLVSGEPAFGSSSKPPIVDLAQLKSVACGVCNFLGGCTSGFSAAQDLMRE